MSNYQKLRAINVNEHTEKKNGLTYLSWAWAVDQLLMQDPEATWSYGEPAKFGETMMVFCTVTAFGKPMTAQLPVMDYRNKAISNPDAFAVNTAMQRCLAKAIALHGLGLYIYSGEDLPATEIGEESAKTDFVKAPTQSITPNAGAGDDLTEDVKEWLINEALEIIADIESENIEAAHDRASLITDNSQKRFLWSKLGSKERNAIKKYAESLKEKTNV
jgi:hypothetical protein